MKVIGLLGGMSWESSAEYYRLINERVKLRLGGLHSAECLLYSLDFARIEAMQKAEAWEEAGAYLSDAAQRLQAGGAACIVLCTNTMHKVAETIQAAVDIPLLHIADPTAAAIQAAGLRRIALLGTKFTMEQSFYRDRLAAQFGLSIIVPHEEQRQLVHEIIYEELCLGIIRDESRQHYVRVIESLAAQGAEGVILGCTEIGLLIDQGDSALPIFDTTLLHAAAAVDWALADIANSA